MSKVRLQTPPNTLAQPDVNLNRNDFDSLIWNKGYNVTIEKAMRCPCKSKGGDNLSSCRNCGGTGWFFINPVETKLVMQGMNFDNKFKSWTQEALGTVRITCMDRDRISWMDRITSKDAESYFSEVLYPIRINDQDLGEIYVASPSYAVLSVSEIFMYNGADEPHIRLNESQYKFARGGYYIQITDQNLVALEDVSISIRYRHHPQFHVIDITRDIMTSYTVDPNTDLKDVQDKFPLSAVGRRSHYVLDRNNYDANYIIDNSYDEE